MSYKARDGAKAQRLSPSNCVVPFVEGFRRPSKAEAAAALGQSPWGDALKQEKRVRSIQVDPRDVAATDSSRMNAAKSLKHIDEMRYYTNSDANGASIWKDLPSPVDDGAWLATVKEEGQTFDEYVSLITLRDGKFRPKAASGKKILYLCPLIRSSDGDEWPADAPSMEVLCRWVGAFFGQEVRVMVPVKLHLTDASHISTSKNKRRRVEDAASVAFQTVKYVSSVKCRVSSDRERFQLQIDDLLSELQYIREHKSQPYRPSQQYGCSVGSASSSTDAADEDVLPPDGAYAVIGITMEDIYSSDDDLFVAGMAAGASRVAVLSFARYHPNMKMHFQCWDDYGYARKMSDYSYFEMDKKRPLTCKQRPQKISREAKKEFLLRAGKLIVHEICHSYGLFHCIYHSCIMNGTAHLVEDFSAPAHLCGVCLRKLNFRLGFDVDERYQNLLQVYRRSGLSSEEAWVRRRIHGLESLRRPRGDDADGDRDGDHDRDDGDI